MDIRLVKLLFLLGIWITLESWAGYRTQTAYRYGSNKPMVWSIVDDAGNVVGYMSQRDLVAFERQDTDVRGVGNIHQSNE